MAGGGKHAHVRPGLGDDHLGGSPPDARDRAQELNRRRERDESLLERVREPLDLLIEEVQVGEDRADQQHVQLVEAALERLAQPRQLLAQAAAGELGEQLGVSGARHQRVEHRPPGGAEDVGGDAVELDVGVLKRLVQPLGLPVALGDLGLAIAGELAQLADRLGRHEVGLQKPRLGELAKPRGIRHVGLADRAPA